MQVTSRAFKVNEVTKIKKCRLFCFKGTYIMKQNRQDGWPKKTKGHNGSERWEERK